MATGKFDGFSDAASLALRIATMALAVASAATMASASQSQRSCTGCSPATIQVSYRDYPSLRYSLLANVISAALQAAAAWLTVRGKADESKAAKSLSEFIDTVVQVLHYSSSGLSFSVDDFGTCGHRIAGVCKISGEFCRRVHASGAVSMAAAVALHVSKYLKEVPASTWFKGDEHKAKPGCGCGRGCHCHH